MQLTVFINLYFENSNYLGQQWGETIDTILNLPAKYDELSVGLVKRLQQDFSHFGLGLTHLYVNAITPPPEVQQAIDDRSRMSVFKDMNKLMQMKAAMAMEKAAQADPGSGADLGMKEVEKARSILDLLGAGEDLIACDWSDSRAFDPIDESVKRLISGNGHRKKRSKPKATKTAKVKKTAKAKKAAKK